MQSYINPETIGKFIQNFVSYDIDSNTITVKESFTEEFNSKEEAEQYIQMLLIALLDNVENIYGKSA